LCRGKDILKILFNSQHEQHTKDSDEEFPFESDEENEINVFHGSYPKVTVPEKGVLLGVL